MTCLAICHTYPEFLAVITPLLLLLGLVSLGRLLDMRLPVRLIFPTLILSAALAGAIVFWLESDNNPLGKQKKNLVIISVCSLKNSIFQEPENARFFPNLHGLMQRSYRFTNAHSPFTWTNVSFLLNYMPFTENIENNFRTFGSGIDLNYFKIRGYDTDFTPPNYHLFVWGEDTGYALKYLNHQLKVENRKPLWGIIHLKKPHIPYIDSSPEIVAQKLPDKLRPRFLRLFKNPQDFPHKVPFLATLFPISWFLEHNYRSPLEPKRPRYPDELEAKVRQRELINIFENPTIISKWKASPGYKEDLELLKQVYLIQVSEFDDDFGRFLSQMKADGTDKSTMILFLGDHGESFMEHDKLFHASSVYDEMTSIPFFAHFPDQKVGHNIEEQVSYNSVQTFLEAYFANDLTERDFKPFARKEMFEEFVISRSCPGDVYSARYKGDWKLIQNRFTGEFELYNLKEDPIEMNNVYGNHFEIEALLKEQLLLNAQKLSDYDVYKCPK